METAVKDQDVRAEGFLRNAIGNVYLNRGQYSEAIDKWEMLRSIYQQYPGLDFEVDRIRRRLEQHTRHGGQTPFWSDAAVRGLLEQRLTELKRRLRRVIRE